MAASFLYDGYWLPIGTFAVHFCNLFFELPWFVYIFWIVQTVSNTVVQLFVILVLHFLSLHAMTYSSWKTYSSLLHYSHLRLTYFFVFILPSIHIFILFFSFYLFLFLATNGSSCMASFVRNILWSLLSFFHKSLASIRRKSLVRTTKMVNS